MLSYDVFETPAMQARYIQRVGDLLAEVVTPERINGILASIEQRIRTQLSPLDPTYAAALLRGVADVRARLFNRIIGANAEYTSYAQQLHLPPRSAARGSPTPAISK